MSLIKLSARECLRGNYCFRLDGYYYKTWEKFEMADYHKHERVEIMFVMEGECCVWLLNERRQREDYTKIVLAKGEGVLIDPDVWHKLVVNDKCKIINMEFLILPCENTVNTIRAASFMSGLLNNLLSKFENFIYFIDRSNVTVFLELILSETEKANVFSDHDNVLNNYCHMLLVEIARSYFSQSPSQPGEIYVKKAIKYITMHVKEKIRSEDIAKYAGANYAHLERLFKSSMGVTLGEYVVKQKIKLAETMLLNTSLSVTAIGSQLGFGSRQQFNNAFKRVNGVSPQKYRNERVEREREMWYGFNSSYAFEIMKSTAKEKSEGKKDEN